MSANSLFMKSGWITANAPLRNGIGRYIPQLARITIKFCKMDGNSNGVRQFIQQDIVQLAKKNPSFVVYLKPRRHRTPVLVAEYLNGERHWLSLHNMGVDEVGAWVDYYRTHSGAEFMSQPKMTYSDTPSVQGMWHPHVHSDPALAVTEFPSDELSRTRNMAPTATENLIQMFNNQVSIDKDLTEGESEKLEKRKQGE
eukprot:TRINITY_DN3278_c0_g1_i1.p1 TRINITY_DN3278_c0_g1~~TRINITY_DN3278_c0_g1_i1.p1  ORF type:complete len:214 (-),score=45.56 TRINITY_DN3278_c0_g1_i1:40-633(-)